MLVPLVAVAQSTCGGTKEMKLCRVLRPFDYSRDGINVVTLSAGTTVPIRDELFPGLIATGLIRLSITDPTHYENKMLAIQHAQIPAVTAGIVAVEDKHGKEGLRSDEGPKEVVPDAVEIPENLDELARSELVKILLAMRIDFFKGSTPDQLRAKIRKAQEKPVS